MATPNPTPDLVTQLRIFVDENIVQPIQRAVAAPSAYEYPLPRPGTPTLPVLCRDLGPIVTLPSSSYSERAPSPLPTRRIEEASYGTLSNLGDVSNIMRGVAQGPGTSGPNRTVSFAQPIGPPDSRFVAIEPPDFLSVPSRQLEAQGLASLLSSWRSRVADAEVAQLRDEGDSLVAVARNPGRPVSEREAAATRAASLFNESDALAALVRRGRPGSYGQLVDDVRPN